MIAIAAAVAAANAAPPEFGMSYYGGAAPQILSSVAVVLIVVLFLLAIGFSLRHDARGSWAILIMLVPIGLLSLDVLGGAVDGLPGRPALGMAAKAGMTVTIMLLGLVVLTTAVAGRRRRLLARR